MRKNCPKARIGRPASGRDPLQPVPAAVQREALLQAEPFLRWQLPALLRRHRLWHGRDNCSRNDVLAELRQELRLDCIEHAATIADLDRSARHVRWFRIAERWLYRHRRAPQRRAVELAFDLPAQPVADEPPAEPSLLADLLPEAPEGVLERMVHTAVQHGNGRCNTTGTAQRLGLPRARLRKLWLLAASRAGYDGEYLGFWQRRLAEALTGLAADLLADAGGLVILPRRRPRPDPRQRLARIRRIRTAMSVRPLPYDLRRLLALALRKSTPPPAELLAAAARLRPYEPSIPMWQFEAAIAGEDDAAEDME